MTIHAANALASDNVLPDEGAQVAKLRAQIKIDLAEGQWWWD